jgi:hypothetical protein
LTAIHKFRTIVESEETEEESVGHHHVIPGKSQSDAVSDDEFTEFEEEERRRQKQYTDQTAADMFWSEMSLVWKAVKYIVKSWFTFPKHV